MPSHWHILPWPERDGDLAGFMQRLTITHVQRWQENRHYVGLGHVYQGRYKSFPVGGRGASISWPWRGTWNAARWGQLGSARGRVTLVEFSGGVVVELRRTRRSWPRGRWRFRKTGWSESIAPTTRASWRATPQRPAGRPYGATEWQKRIAKRLGLESAYRSPGRPGIARRDAEASDS